MPDPQSPETPVVPIADQDQDILRALETIIACADGHDGEVLTFCCDRDGNEFCKCVEEAINAARPVYAAKIAAALAPAPVVTGEEIEYARALLGAIVEEVSPERMQNVEYAFDELRSFLRSFERGGSRGR